MKKTLFLMTHLGSGWQNTVNILNSDPRIEISMTGLQYHHPDDIDFLTRQPHKSSNSVAIWGDVILHNHNFTCQSLFNDSYFVFLNSEFDINHSEWKGYTDSEIYYRMRLFGMNQYFRRAVKSIWNPKIGDFVEFFK
jgi:hypothetical protein